MYALVTVTHWYYCNKKNVEIKLYNTLKEAQELVRIVHTAKAPDIIKTYNNKTTWQYPNTTNGEETFSVYITDDIEPPRDNEVQISMFDELE